MAFIMFVGSWCEICSSLYNVYALRQSCLKLSQTRGSAVRSKRHYEEFHTGCQEQNVDAILSGITGKGTSKVMYESALGLDLTDVGAGTQED